MSDLAYGIIAGMLFGAPFSMGALILVQARNLKKTSGPAPKLQPDPLPVAPFKPFVPPPGSGWRAPAELVLPASVLARRRPDGTVSYSRSEQTLDELAPKIEHTFVATIDKLESALGVPGRARRDDEPTQTFTRPTVGAEPLQDPPVPSRRYEVAS